MIHFELVTPERVVFQQDIDEVTLPTAGGEITVLEQHIPLVATLVPGIVRLRKNGVEEDVAVSGGFIEVSDGTHIRVLADSAERAFELNFTIIEEAKQRAEQVMKEIVRSDDVAYARAAAALERETARFAVARRHHGKSRVPTIDSANLPSDQNPS